MLLAGRARELKANEIETGILNAHDSPISKEFVLHWYVFHPGITMHFLSSMNGIMFMKEAQYYQNDAQASSLFCFSVQPSD